jgi:magnesium transporter
MEIRLISPEGLEHRHVDELDQLLAGPDLVWVDVPSWDDEAAQVLGKLLSLHPRAMQDCAQRNPLPKVHVFPDHVFVVLHAPEQGERYTCTTSSWTSSSARATSSPCTGR